MYPDRKFILGLIAISAGCICVLPIIGFVLSALWPQRVLVSWLVLGAIGVALLVVLSLRIIRTLTGATIAMQEQSLRPARLHDHERLIATEFDQFDLTSQSPSTVYPQAQLPYEHGYGPTSLLYEGPLPQKLKQD